MPDNTTDRQTRRFGVVSTTVRGLANSNSTDRNIQAHDLIKLLIPEQFSDQLAFTAAEVENSLGPARAKQAMWQKAPGWTGSVHPELYTIAAGILVAKSPLESPRIT